MQKHMDKDTLVAVETYNLLANKQYDSRLYRSAIHLAINKWLIYNISIQMKKLLRCDQMMRAPIMIGLCMLHHLYFYVN